MMSPSFPTQAFIDGALVDAASGKTFPTWNPATGQVLAQVAECAEVDADRAIKAARRSFDSGVWSRTSPTHRKAVLQKFASLIESNLQTIAYLDSTDAGKTIFDCVNIDIPDVVATINWYAEAIDKVYDRIAPTGPENFGMIVKEPIGVVVAVLPWNFPAMMLGWKLGPALATGNSIVVKPAEQSPLSAIFIAQLASEAGIPDGVFNVVPGYGEVAGKALALSNFADLATFTGSTSVGKQFLRYSADSNMKKIVLECGGKSPQIVMKDAASYLDAVIPELVNAAFWNTGQNCTAGSRILVHESIEKDLVAALTAATKEVPVGDPAKEETRLGPVIETEALDRVLRYVDGATKAGATIAHGGNRIMEETGGWFVSPTIITDVKPDMAVAREEIFGPVVSVLTFKSEAEAIALANDTDYGLAGSVFTKDLDAAHRLSRAVRAGVVSVNCYGEGSIGTPFGGYKTSGFGGKDKGLEALDQYTETKTIWYSLDPTSPA